MDPGDANDNSRKTLSKYAVTFIYTVLRTLYGDLAREYRNL